MAGGTDIDGVKLLTPSKITAWLDCDHYLTLRRRADAGEIKPTNEAVGSFARLLMDKGLVHERNYLARLRADGRNVCEVPGKLDGERFEAWAARSGDVLAAGYDVIYQMPMVNDGLRGVADFLVRVDTPSELGPFSYEPVDAKLARREAKPGHVLQLCFYSDGLEAIQGRRPQLVHLYLGSGGLESVRVHSVDAYWRRVRGQLRRVVALDEPADTSPAPCLHCEFCEFADMCEVHWRERDALYFVANIRSSDIAKLELAGIDTMAALASSTGDIEGLQRERLDVLRQQAMLQREAKPDGPPPFRPLAAPPEADPHRVQLPAPNPADIFLDFEGHPFWTPSYGLFFLFGLIRYDVAADDWVYDARWAHDRSEEAAQTKDLIEWMASRRNAHPGMHVYHYNHTERSSLQRLAADYGAAETQLTELITHGVFVDVLDVVRHRVRVGAESYGLKTMELLTSYERNHDIDQGAGAVVEYEAWCSEGGINPVRLERIARYNDDDVRATLAVREWLIDNPLAGDEWRPLIEPESDDTLIDQLAESLIATGAEWKELLAHLLGYWHREGRAHWAQHAVLFDASPADQLAHPEVVAGLRFQGLRAPSGKQHDPRAVFHFPPQELSAEIVDGAKDAFMFPVGTDRAVTVTTDELDVDNGVLVVGWPSKAAETGVLPTAVVLNDWVGPGSKPDSVKKFAQSVLDGTVHDTDDARCAVLRRDLPRFTPGQGPANGRFTADIDQIADIAAHLDRSCLAVQGPPGTGKTFAGAHIIERLVASGLRVGVTAFSHHAINNLVRCAIEQRPGLRVLRQGPPPKAPTDLLPDTVYSADRKKWDSGDYDLLAGTSWIFSGPKMTDTAALDVLIIDEAGQMGLADAVAAMASADNVILLGDPLQLAQVSLASHPGGAGASVLEHVLGSHATIPDDRGVFLDTTWRMHPDVCSFLSEQIYDGRLVSQSDCANQSIGGGSGLRWIQAQHEDCSTSSAEEAALVADLVRSLVGRTWRDASRNERPLTANDVMVVAPYNDHVDLVRSTLNAEAELVGARVGTVDKFQGQEAPVVVFTMATSTGADMPRTSDFLFSQNRLNVAVSRARALAYVICTEELLDTRARSVDEMKLINTLCAFVEKARDAGVRASNGGMR